MHTDSTPKELSSTFEESPFTKIGNKAAGPLSGIAPPLPENVWAWLILKLKIKSSVIYNLFSNVFPKV